MGSWLRPPRDDPSVSLISVSYRLQNRLLGVENALAYMRDSGLKEQLSNGKNSIGRVKSVTEMNLPRSLEKVASLSRVLKRSGNVAADGSTVLIDGETGHGNEPDCASSS